MSPKTRVLTAAAALVTCVTLAGCDDIPILPQWDTDFYATLGSSNVAGITGGVVIPPNTSASVPGLVRTAPMDGTTGDLLDQVLDKAAPVIRLRVTVTKTANLTLALNDTIYLAGSNAGLATSTIANGFTMAANQTTITDTLALGPSAITLLKSLVASGDTLYLQARGRVSNGNSAVTVQNNDSINVKIGVLVRVPVAGGN